MSHQGAVPMYNGSYVQPGYGQGAMNPYMQQQQVMQQAQQQQMYQQQQQQQAMQQQQQQMMQLQQRYQQDLQRGAVPIVNGRPLDFSSYVGYLQQQQGQQQQGYPQGGVYGGAQQGYPQGGVYGGTQQPNPYGMPQQHNPYQSSNMSSVYNQPSRVGYGNPQQAFGPMVARDTTTGVESAPSRFSGSPKAQQPQVQQQQVQTQVPQHHQPYQQQPQQVSGAEHVEHNRYSSIPQGATTYREAPKPTHEIAVASDKPVEKIKLKRVGKVKMKYLGKLPYGNENVGITGNVPTPRDQFEELGVITTDRYGAIREAVFPEDTKGFTTIARVESPIVTLPVSFFMSGVFSNASSFHENLKNLVVLSDDLDSLVYARELDKLVTASINDVVKVDYDVTIDSFIDDYDDLIKHVAHNKQLDSEHVVKAKLETILENNYCRAYREEVEEIKAEEDFELNEDGAIIEVEVEEFDRRESIGVMEQGICVHVDHYSDLLGLNMKDVQAKEGELLDISSEPSYFKVLLTQAEGINMRTFGMGASITSFMVVAKDAVVLKFVRSKEGEWFVSRPQSLLI